MDSKIKDEYSDFLFDCILALKDRDECYAFFEDLCTVPEVKSLAQRLQVAKMLTDGKVYKDIVGETGASTATISRVNRSLRYGCNGYDKVFRRVAEKSKGKKDE